MTVYADTSALLASLLGEPSADIVDEILSEGDPVVSSELALIEVARAFHRRGAVPDLLLRSMRQAIVLMPISADVVRLSCGELADRHLRALDAIHAATALLAIGEQGGGPFAALVLDKRLRAVLASLGVRVVPQVMPS